jgi:4-amino-4-deoxy-L-arabinose transferase-like glycosyltransferase
VELSVTLVVTALAFVLADAAARGPHFNPDESRWLSRAHYLSALTDPFGPTWTDRYMTRGQPPLGSYMMGVGLLAQGRDLETNPPWNFSVPWEVNIALGRKPVPQDLAAGRRTSALLIALTTAALVGVARVFVSTPWAIAAGALFAVHPFTTYVGSIAMSDALFGLSIVLAAWATAAFARGPTPARAILVGVLLGLGGATKLSPLVVAAGLSAAAVLLWAVSALQRRRLMAREAAYAIHGLVVGIAAVVTFVASYPYLWPDPIGHTQNLFAFRAGEMAAQSSDWPVMAVPNRVEALRRVNVNFTERFSLSGTALSWLGDMSAPPLVRQIEFLIPVVGVLIMAGMAIRDGPFSPRFQVLAVLGSLVLVTILGMRSEFDRYHLPMALLGAVAAAVTLEWLARGAFAVLKANGRSALSAGVRN